MAASGALKSYKMFDFSGGLDLQTAATKLVVSKGPGRLTSANNVVYDADGAVSRRRDMRRVNGSASIGAGITGGFAFKRSDVPFHTIIVGTDNGSLLILGDPPITLATGLTANRRWSFAAFNDVVICCNGADAPRTWDGAATIATLGGSPPSTGSVVCVHRNRVWMLDNDEPSRLSFSALNTHDDWTAVSDAGSIFINPNDGQSLTGMMSLLSGELVLQKPNGLYRVQGATYSDITVSPVSSGAAIGGYSFQAFLQAANDAWFASTAGIHTLSGVQQFGDLREALVSYRLSPYFSQEPTPQGVNLLRHLDNAQAAYDSRHNRLVFAFPNA